MACACVTAPRRPARPALYLENLPQTIITQLTLDERIAVEEAWSHLRNGKGQKALKIFHLLGAKNPAYYIGLGYANILLNRYQTSEKHFTEGLKTYPDMILIHLGLAQLYQKTGEENKAFAEYAEVLKRNPRHRFAREEYEILKSKKTQEALEEGKYYLTIDNTERAKEAFLKALYYSPESREAHLALAEIYKSENSLEEALAHLEALSSLEPQNAAFLRDYADALYALKRYEKSLDIYEELFALHPQDTKLKSRIESIRNRLGIFELPSQYRSLATKEEITREDLAALLAVKFQAIIDTQRRKPPIIIDISTSWASRFILKTTSIGLLDVFPNHTFRPEKIVTRAELAETLIRLLKFLEKKGYRFIHQIPAEKIELNDVSPENYYYQPIKLIVSYQIMDLTAENKFRPEHPVSGEEAQKIMDIILGLMR